MNLRAAVRRGRGPIDNRRASALNVRRAAIGDRGFVETFAGNGIPERQAATDLGQYESCRCVGQNFALLALTCEAVRLRVDARRGCRLDVGDVHMAIVALCSRFVMTMRKGMMLRPMGQQERNQAENTDPARLHRESLPRRNDHSCRYVVQFGDHYEPIRIDQDGHVKISGSGKSEISGIVRQQEMRICPVVIGFDDATSSTAQTVDQVTPGLVLVVFQLTYAIDQPGCGEFGRCVGIA